MRRFLVFLAGTMLLALPAMAQQTGTIEGRVSLEDGAALPGALVEADSDVLPRPRSTVTNAAGDYRLPGLPPGQYVLTYTMDGMATVKREVTLFLQQTLQLNVTMGPEAVEESIVVVGEAPLIDLSSAELKNSIADDVIDNVPIGQEYRDIVKLIPGVQYTEDAVRGPSAGGSGQDNVYLFDGVNVNLPLFGVLSAEPSNHDIDQVSIIKGGAQATGFNRSAGFTINTISKTGTDQYRGEVSYQIQTDSMTGDRDVVSDAEFDRDRDWTVFNIGGPAINDRLFFYASYFRPTIYLENRANLYGDVPDLDSTRDELFGKLTFTPTDSLLLHASYRDSDRSTEHSGAGGSATAGTATTGSEATLEIAILEGSWVINEKSFLSFKYTDFANDTASRPDTLFNFPIRTDGTIALDVNNLDMQGLFQVPSLLDGEDAYNAFIQPLIDRYGFAENGIQNGGGLVGGATTINDQDFFRESFEIGFDYLFGDRVSHELHIGYQTSEEEEDLARLSNGWGFVTVPGGRFTTADGTPYFYEARFEQMSILDDSGNLIPPIHSEFKSQSFEINDSIQWDNWTVNIGFIASNDELFGQGLRENSANVSGFELAAGNIYKMYEIDFEDQIQPRLGVIWAYNGEDTVYANFARYNPASSSLPRAASWARNLRRTIEARFDADGNLLEVDPVRSSSGKFFQDDLDPRYTDEFLIGTSQRLPRNITLRAHARHRYSSNFWEDTNNNARSRFDAPAGFPQEDYIPNLGDFRAEVGGSSYVIAELDNAFTKYYEAGVEAEWRGGNAFVKGSYVWSHYYGTFDQDNTTTDNDQAIFMGSSNLADGAGRQIWNFRYGNLKGDRRHQLKVYGYYGLKWNASLGAFAIYQSGQPWEAWDVEVYRQYTSSTSDTTRYAEPAGSRTTSAHYQLDLNYTQNFQLGGERYNLQLVLDVFNLFDKQTGYNIQNKVNSAGFGEARSFFDPRRLQLAVRFQF